MKSKKTLMMCLFLSLTIATPSAQAFGWLLRFGRVGSVTKNSGKLGRAGSAASSASKIDKLKSAAKGIAGTAATGVIINEGLQYFDFAQAEAGEMSNSTNYNKSNPYLYSNTIELGDPELVW